MRGVVAERGQVTIPKPIRDRLGIKPGTILEFTEESGHFIVEKAVTTDGLDQAYGKFGKGRKTDDLVKELRGET